MVIDQNHVVVAIAASQDVQIARIGPELDKTYLPYGVQGRVGVARRAVQKTNIITLAPAS